MKPKTIFWLVGENSGDLHAELVLAALQKQRPDLIHTGIGGPRMQKHGLKPLYPFERFAVMGFVEVLKHLPFFLRVQKDIKDNFAANKPDLVILVDYPGLNMRIARLASLQGIPVLYFICPQFWAWKQERVHQLRRFTSLVACILPFETPLLASHGVKSQYVGHPIAEEIKLDLDRDSFAKKYGLDPKKKWLGFFPGSRNNEIAKMLPVFLEAAKKWGNQSYELLFSQAANLDKSNYNRILSGFPVSKLITGNNYEMMRYCDLLVCTSGTVTLESAFLGTPLLICYKASLISYLIGRFFVRINRIGLPNIILNKDLLPELIQHDMNPETIFERGNQILCKDELNRKIRNELQQLQSILSDKRSSIEMPKLILELLGDAD